MTTPAELRELADLVAHSGPKDYLRCNVGLLRSAADRIEELERALANLPDEIQKGVDVWVQSISAAIRSRYSTQAPEEKDQPKP